MGSYATGYRLYLQPLLDTANRGIGSRSNEQVNANCINGFEPKCMGRAQDRYSRFTGDELTSPDALIAATTNAGYPSTVKVADEL